MRQLVLAVSATVLLFGCASAPRASYAPSPFGSEAALDAAPAAAVAATPLAQARPPARKPPNYAQVKAGGVWPSESDIDPGWLIGGSFGQYVNQHVSLEFEGAYTQADLDAPGADLFAMPMLFNIRGNFPVAFLDMYAGGGFGSTYYDIESNSLDIEGWLFAFDAFVGVEYAIRENMTAGVELKYYFTEEIDRTDDRLDSLALLATIGWRF